MVGENQSSEVRKYAAKALGELGEHAASSVPALTKCILDRFVRKNAVTALGQLGEHAASCVPALLQHLENKHPDVRKAAGDALGELGEHAASSVPMVTKYLEHEDKHMRTAKLPNPLSFDKIDCGKIYIII